MSMLPPPPMLPPVAGSLPTVVAPDGLPPPAETPAQPVKTPIQAGPAIDGALVTQLLREWYAAQAHLNNAKNKESEMRIALLRAAFPKINWDLKTYGDNSGTHRLGLGPVYTLKLQAYDRYGVENTEGLDAALEKLPPATADAVIEWKPSLVRDIYLEMTPAERAIMDPLVTIVANAPQIKIEGLD